MERILFFGRNTRYTLSILGLLELHENLSIHHTLVGVVHTSESSSNATCLEKVAHSLNLPTFQFENNNINSEEALARFRQLNPTLIIVVQFPKIFKTELFSLPKNGAFNVHRGYPLRGGSIDQRLILEQRSFCSLIFHSIDKGIDTGNILEEEKIFLDPQHETGHSIDLKTSQACIKLFRNKIIPRIENRNFAGTKQDIEKTLYENKWRPERKVVDPQKITFEEGEKLARALSHPREKGLILRLNSKPYTWTFGEPQAHKILLDVQWMDLKRKLFLKP